MDSLTIQSLDRRIESQGNIVIFGSDTSYISPGTSSDELIVVQNLSSKHERHNESATFQLSFSILFFCSFNESK
nr:AEL_HP1_G0051620.mRNA.1.CDS.1 [Saccharomyces cerevisiae]